MIDLLDAVNSSHYEIYRISCVVYHTQNITYFMSCIACYVLGVM